MSFTQGEKDEMKEEAGRAYQRCYGEPTNDAERFYVQKGIEAMAAVVFGRLQFEGRVSGEYPIDEICDEDGNGPTR